MNTKHVGLLFCFLNFCLVLTSCKEKSVEWPDEHFAATEIEAANDLRLPETLWQKLSYEDTKTTPPSGLYQFLPATIEMVEKTPGVLKTSPVVLQLTAGGGKIDLAQYLSGNQGTFYIRLRFGNEAEDKEPRIFFLSNARKRRIGDEIWGTGCNSYTDITDYYRKTLSKSGLAVNTTQARYVSLLAGSFVFAANDGKQIALSQISLTDSTQERLLCANEGEK